MKKQQLFYLLVSVLFFSQIGYSQTQKNNSIVTAQNAYWTLVGKQIPITEALKGVLVKDELELVIELSTESLTKVGNTLQKFEINWYRYGSRGLYLTDSFIQEINLGQTTKEKFYSLKTKRQNLQSGWWIVRVTAYADDGYVTFQEKSQFKIKVL